MKSILMLAAMTAFAFTAFAEPAKTEKPTTQCPGAGSNTVCCKAAAAKGKTCCGDKCTCACCAK